MVVFGDIAVHVKSTPKNSALHGYSEYVFTLVNHSPERSHQVTLVMPQEAGWSRHEDTIRSVSRTVQVEPRTTLQVPLLHPDYPSLVGSGLKVIIDGKEQQDGVPVSFSSRRGATWVSGYGRRARHYSKSPGENEYLILVSQRVGETFRPEGAWVGVGAAPVPPPAPPGRPDLRVESRRQAELRSLDSWK